MKTVAIIGAGAAGLSCVKTLLAYQHQINICLFERNASIAKKISATGNGHCNLSNASINRFAYQGDITDQIFDMIQSFDIASFCSDLGFLIRKKGDLYYPYSYQAKTVVRAFEQMLQQNHIQVYLSTQIIDIMKLDNGYRLIDQHGQKYDADFVVVSAGGKAGKGFGTDGQIFDVLNKIGLECSALSPSLVALTIKENVKKLKGCRFHGTFSLKKDGNTIASYQGEALFTENGISGIACMQLSRFLNFLQTSSYTLHCNLIDEMENEVLEDYYYHHNGDYYGIIQDKLADYLSYKKVKSFLEFKERLTNLSFNIIGTRDFEFAQVTKGGILVSQLDEHLMAKSLPNLYLCGEVLNIDGDCGGYNLHFAFASGIKVGQQLIKQLEC